MSRTEKQSVLCFRHHTSYNKQTCTTCIYSVFASLLGLPISWFDSFLLSSWLCWLIRQIWDCRTQTHNATTTTAAPTNWNKDQQHWTNKNNSYNNQTQIQLSTISIVDLDLFGVRNFFFLFVIILFVVAVAVLFWADVLLYTHFLQIWPHCAFWFVRSTTNVLTAQCSLFALCSKLVLLLLSFDFLKQLHTGLYFCHLQMTALYVRRSLCFVISAYKLLLQLTVNVDLKALCTLCSVHGQ